MRNDPLRVLIIEDNRHDYQMAELALNRSEKKFVIDWVQSVDDALPVIATQQHDVITLDLNMPKVVGLEFLERIIRTGTEIPVIVVTGTGNERAAVEAIQMGAASYLAKDSVGNYLALLPITMSKVYDQWQNRKAQEEAAEQERLLEVERERTRILTEFITNVSHEIRTPLSVLNSSVYLATKTEDQAVREKHLDKLKAQVDTITRLVDQMTLMMRIDSLSSIDVRPVDVRVQIRYMCAYFQQLAQKKDVTVTYAVPENPVTLLVDSFYLDIALSQIIDNAMTFTHVGGSVNVQLSIGQDHACIVVEDTGIGMDADTLKHIFERFYRQDTARTTSGFGLGLPVALKILELHRGTIQVESCVGMGTKVTMQLPR